VDRSIAAPTIQGVVRPTGMSNVVQMFETAQVQCARHSLEVGKRASRVPNIRQEERRLSVAHQTERAAIWPPDQKDQLRLQPYVEACDPRLTFREVAPYAAAVEMSGGGLFPVERRAVIQQMAAERRAVPLPMERRSMLYNTNNTVATCLYFSQLASNDGSTGSGYFNKWLQITNICGKARRYLTFKHDEALHR